MDSTYPVLDDKSKARVVRMGGVGTLGSVTLISNELSPETSPDGLKPIPRR